MDYSCHDALLGIAHDIHRLVTRLPVPKGAQGNWCLGINWARRLSCSCYSLYLIARLLVILPLHPVRDTQALDSHMSYFLHHKMLQMLNNLMCLLQSGYAQAGESGPSGTILWATENGEITDIICREMIGAKKYFVVGGLLPTPFQLLRAAQVDSLKCRCLFENGEGNARDQSH